MVFYRKGRITNAITLETIHEIDGEEAQRQYGHGLYMGTRAIVLRSLLGEAMTGTNEDGSPVTIVYDADVVDYVWLI